MVKQLAEKEHYFKNKKKTHLIGIDRETLYACRSLYKNIIQLLQSKQMRNPCGTT